MAELSPVDRAPDVAARLEPAGAERHAAAIAEHERRNHLGPLFWVPLGWLMAVLLAALLVPHLGLAEPDTIDWTNIKSPPSAEHWFGTDVLGRDLLARVVYGARTSLTVGFAAPALGIAVGLLLGIVAGFYKGWADELIGIAIDTWLAVPGLVILLLFSIIFGGSLLMVCGSLGLLFIPSAARITRAATLNCLALMPTRCPERMD